VDMLKTHRETISKTASKHILIIKFYIGQISEIILRYELYFSKPFID